MGTVPHGPFHHLSHFIHATGARLKPHWLHLEPCICQYGCRVIKTIPMYECRTYCKQSIEEICAGWGGGYMKALHNLERRAEFARSTATRHFWKRPMRIGELGMEGSPCRDSEGLSTAETEPCGRPLCSSSFAFLCKKNAELFMQRRTAPSAKEAAFHSTHAS